MTCASSAAFPSSPASWSAGERKLSDSARGFALAFFASNPHATEADFVRLWPRLRDDAMLQAGKDVGADAERREVERQHPRYNI